MNKADRAIELMRQLISVDTTPEKPTAPLLNMIEDLFQQNGVVYKKKMIKDGAHGVLLGRIGDDKPGGCLISGHLDVVSVEGQEWATDPFTLHHADRRLYGRGACDMKGFIACALSLIPDWRQQKLETPIYLGFTTDEETSVETINDLIGLIDPVNRPRIAILGEPTSMEIVNGHKGVQEFFVDIKGIASHASRPDLGENAIYVAHDIIGFVRDLGTRLEQSHRDYSFNPPYATTNVGTISGGIAVNIVAEACRVAWDIRQILNQQADEVKAEFAAYIKDVIEPNYPNAKILVNYMFMPALEPRSANMAVDVAQHLLGLTYTETASFATEGGYLQAVGIDTIVCGPGSIKQAHKADEYVDVTQIEQCVTMLEGLSRPDILAQLASPQSKADIH